MEGKIMAENTVQTQNGVPVHTEQQQPPVTREESRFLIPPVDIFEKDDGLIVVADLPGVDKENVDIRVDNGILTIQATVRRETRGEGLYNEFALLDYFRQFQISDRIDQEKIKAELKNGVLTITLQKAEKAKPRQIQVNMA